MRELLLSAPSDLPGHAPDPPKLRSEPRSVLEQRSPSPQTSGSPEWASDLAPIPSPLAPDLGFPDPNLPFLDPNFDLDFAPFPFPALDSPWEDRLAVAAAMAEDGRLSSALEILARLNHPLDQGGPFAKTAFLFREALLRFAVGLPPPPPAAAADVALRAAAQRALSAAAPAPQFAAFTCAQAILEAAAGAARLHVVDFDMGLGAQWAALVQEAALLRRDLSLLRITGWAGDPVEARLARDSLTDLASDLGLPIQVNVDPGELTGGVNEAVVVRLPPWSPPAVLRLVKQLRPRVAVCVDHGEGDLILAVRSAAALFDAVAAAGVDSADVARIEQHWVGPRLERAVAARCGGQPTLSWREAFAAAGFEPVEPSRFAEMQADGLIRKSRLRGFHVEKKGAALALCWKSAELATVAAWR
ncbi:scarecrow-like protein 6 [Wolffia australiana]